jgi:hypothetical protein
MARASRARSKPVGTPVHADRALLSATARTQTAGARSVAVGEAAGEVSAAHEVGQ